MANVPAGFEGEEGDLYAESRRVLLDALIALAEHRDSLVLIGAQAVYLRSEDAQLRVAAYTSDGDIGVDPRSLADMPLIEAAMRSAGFELSIANQPGIWSQSITREVGEPFSISVDLLVPEQLAGSGRRSAQIPPHDKSSARRVPGIEAAMIDKSPLPIRSLDPSRDPRTCTINVAGPAALLIAKGYKIFERVNSDNPGRASDKDAGDVVRLMMTNAASTVRATLRMLEAHEMAGTTARAGFEYLQQLFGTEQLEGTKMATRALQGSMDADRVQAITGAYMRQLRAD